MLYIRDRFYGYMPISPLEEILLQQPEVLRLHRILQNSTLYHTYPNNRTTRFSHSIGAMHVVGLLFRSLITNSDDKHIKEIHHTVQDFLKTASDHSQSLDNARNYLIKTYDKKNLNEDESMVISGEIRVETDPEKVDFYSIAGWRMRSERLKKHIDDYEYYYNTINNILLQSIRLAALVHDIGHPPYSHACEYPIEDIATNGLDRWSSAQVSDSVNNLVEDYLEVIAKNTLGEKATKDDAKDLGIERGHLHEMIGTILINELYVKDRLHRDNRHSEDADEKEFWRICLKIALRIISVEQVGHFHSHKFVTMISQEKIKNIFLGWYALGNLINGPVDCDRLDFLQRDPGNSGIADIGSFDFSRIVNSIMLVHPEPTDVLPLTLAEQLLVPGFDRRAISALTDFFHGRMCQYRWLVNHHNVVRTDLALSRLILELIHIYDKGTNDIICKVLEKYNFQGLWNWKNLLENFRYIDDSWLETMLQDLNKTIKIYEESSVFGNDAVKDVEIDECWLLLKVIFERKVTNLITVWKRIDGFIPFAQGFMKGFKSELSKGPIPEIEVHMNHIRLDNDAPSDSEAILVVNQLLDLWDKYGRNFLHLRPYTVMEKVEQIVNRKYQGRIVFVLKSTNPYDKVAIVKHDGTRSYLEKMSSLVNLLPEIFSQDIKLYAYHLPPKREGIYIEPIEGEEWDDKATISLGTETGIALVQCFREFC